MMLRLSIFCLLTLTGCPAEPGIPPIDECATPDTSPVRSLELGHSTLDSVFEPWEDNDSVSLTYGSQGGAMIPIRIRIDGSGGCLETSFKVYQQDELLLQQQIPLRFYMQDDGARVSATHFLIVAPQPSTGDQVDLILALGGMEEMVSLRIGP